MKVLFFVAVVIFALNIYSAMYYYTFKQRYKKWFGKLFPNGEKPCNWSLSRGTNRIMFIQSHNQLLITTAILLVVVLICCGNMRSDPLFYLITFAAPTLLSLFIGWIRGRVKCKKEVFKQCDKCGISKTNL